MAIQVSGTQVIGNSRELTNIASVDATTAAAIGAAGVGTPQLYWGVTSMTNGNENYATIVYNASTSTWVSVSANNGNKVAASTDDGSTWTVYNTGVSYSYGMATNNTGTYISVGAYNRLQRSTNGTSFSSVNPFSDNRDYESVAYANGTWIASYGSNIVRSTNGGVSWTKYNTGSSKVCFGVAGDGAGNWIVNSQYDGDYYHSTNDGVSWTARDTGVAAATRDVAYGNGKWIIVGGEGSISTSTNGTSWTNKINVGSSTDNSKVSYGYGGFIIVTAAGQIGLSKTGDIGTWGFIEPTPLSAMSTPFIGQTSNSSTVLIGYTKTEARRAFVLE